MDTYACTKPYYLHVYLAGLLDWWNCLEPQVLTDAQIII